ncbi:hypothetical protein DYU05_03970 [Mucilaginibacter terrenus]|uniref:Uncharacterized protein n=1 Tax=Mucilaginibacter terrenus TaxID=2482727 RepID=A0A3E2NUT5_9SPHI|nr:hypothetical protein [Mucilaginibacter terrenus]RFZ84772.1 hypothetical protein DYU05_03970 [Mucilaginibacter terrenus]
MKRGIYAGRSVAFLGAGLGPGAVAALGRANRYTAEDLENEAAGLSNFSGGMSGYTGEGDDFLEFSGESNGSFMDAIHKGKIFNLTLTNGNAATRTALLCPGLVFAAAGLIADGAFNDASGASGLTGTGNPQSILLFNNFIRNYPTLVAGFKISTSNINQFECVLTIQKESPFSVHESKIINPAIYASEANPNTTLITVGEAFYMDNQTKISYQVLGSSSVNIGLIFGASLNPAKALRSKATRAKTTVAAVSSFRGR